MKVVISKDAESDIQEIVDYSFHNFSQVTALEYIQSLRSATESLSMSPFQGRSYEHVRTGLRRLVIGKHTIYYQVQSSHLMILRILHQAQDPISKL
ncbi:hypothetical protein C9927_00800 [Pseudidiomarina aestuarii]|uniref:Toxin n=1 Tax=Pseudidiomarina aestuarii TaxID=624146 RepID=A0A2T4CNG0_9GAMM|nr:hypothetical protein C9986_01300 [Pseudidiomarina aestuarii]PTB90124.1 hypothetical protein C9927_00800 [Pseudidiomarina aestuarii]